MNQHSMSASPADTREPSDYLSKEGALALKTKIESYWAERGMSVMLALHNVGFHPAIRAVRYDLRSDMINGLPRVRAAPRAPEVDDDELDLDDVFLD